MDTREVVDGLIKALRAEQTRKGVPADGSAAYTLGYIGSALSDVIESLPKKTREQVLQNYVRRVFECSTR